MKCINLVCMLCLLHLTSAVCECGNGQQSVIPSFVSFNPPSPFNGTDGTTDSFGTAAGCTEQGEVYNCNGNADNPLFDCSTSNNSYYGWDRVLTASLTFGRIFHSMNILVTFLISTSSNVSAPASLQYAAVGQNGMIPSDPIIPLPINLPEGPYQHNYTLSSDVMFVGVVITVIPNTTFQWVAINRIIFCPAAAITEDHSSSTISLSTSVTTSSMITPDATITAVSPVLSTHVSSTVSPTISTSTTVSSTVSPTIGDNDDDSVNVAVISGAVVGTLLLTIIIIIITMVMIMILCRRRKESRRGYNIDDNVQLSHLHFPQQHTDNTSGKHDPTSKLETVNALYMPTKVKSVDSLLRHIDDRSRSDVIDCDVTITPNPSYAIGHTHSGKESEYQYDYVQPDNGLVKQVECTTSTGGDEVTVDNVNIDTNPSYSVAQDVKLEDNPSYDKLQL